MLGKPVIKGTGLPVEIIVEKVAYGATIDGLKKDYPFLKEDDIRAALLYAQKESPTKKSTKLKPPMFNL